MEIKNYNGFSYYEGFIRPSDNVIFVFGSNLEGRHGAGAALFAKNNFGAIYGKSEGLQGNSYAIPTKDISKHTWARYSDNSYEVSSVGDSRFSAHFATFKPGTVVFGHDVSNRTIESVYQHGVKQGDWISDDNYKTGFPKDKTIIKGFDEDASFLQGYLPLWKIWASQNLNLIDDLRVKCLNKTLTDCFALSRVSQARAVSCILNEQYKSLSPVFIIKNIERLYSFASNHLQNQSFVISYSNPPDKVSLNGYSGLEMMEMFLSAGKNGIPSNIVFSETWVKNFHLCSSYFLIVKEPKFSNSQKIDNKKDNLKKLKF